MRLLLPLLCTLLLSTPAAATETVAGRWTVVQGRVTVTKAGAAAPVAARAGDSVVVGDLLETGGDTKAQALLADNTVLNLSDRTAVRILQYAFDPATDRRTSVVKVYDGQVRFIAPARKGSRFNVESAQAGIAATAARTVDFVAVVAPGQTTVAVLDGNVRVRNTSPFVVESVDLAANQFSVVADKTAPTYSAPLTNQQRKACRNDARAF